MNVRIGKSKKIAALALLASLLVAAAALGEHRNWKWWKRGPVPAVVDVAFSNGTARNGRVRNITVANGSIKLRSKLDLSDTSFTASVASGVISFSPISQSRGVVTVGVVLDPATLQRTIFNSTFTGSGTATIATADAQVTLPVTVVGTITQHQGQYRLKGDIRGLSGISTAAATILKIELLALADIPAT